MTKRTDQERQYKCGYCGARPGQACLSPRGKHHNVYHQDRVNRRIDAEAETLDPEETLAGLDEDARVVVAELGEEGSTMSRIASGACALTRPGKRPRYVRSTTVDDLRRRMVVTTIRNSPPAYGLTGHGRRVAQAARAIAAAGVAALALLACDAKPAKCRSADQAKWIEECVDRGSLCGSARR